MSAFDRAAAFTMRHEGGARISEDPRDPGGLTKYGISQRAYPLLKIRALTEAEALAIYRRDYWDALHGDALPPVIAIPLFDFAFNSGPGKAIKTLQHMLALNVDGMIGDQTLSAIRSIKDPARTALHLNAERLLFLAALPTWPTFGRGWARRVLALQGQLFEIFE